MAIQLYVVGIYFNKPINFKADNTTNNTMSGQAILEAAALSGLRSKLMPNGLLSQMSYTPDSVSAFKPGSTNTGLIGYSLCLDQTFGNFPVAAEVLQYTSSLEPTISTSHRPAFGTNGFKDGSNIRIRLIKIYEPAPSKLIPPAYNPSTVTLWGAINKDGNIIASSGNFSCRRETEGNYTIDYSKVGFTKTPAAVGSQNQFGTEQSTLDNVIFPAISSTVATVITGDSGGNAKNRSFGFTITGSI